MFSVCILLKFESKHWIHIYLNEHRNTGETKAGADDLQNWEALNGLIIFLLTNNLIQTREGILINKLVPIRLEK